jgi:hypothetical protein
LGKKDFIAQDGTLTDVQTYVVAISLGNPWPSGWTWEIGCNIENNDCVVYISPYTQQTTIFTGHYTLTPLGLTG